MKARERLGDDMKWFKSLRRLVDKPPPLSEEQRDLIDEKLPWAQEFEDDEYERFELQLRRFMHEKIIKGDDGLEVTDEMRLLVAGSAARLTRNIGDAVYHGLDTVILHDSAVHADEHHVVLGTASTFGVVDLSWNAVTEGLDDPGDGHDTALHEFAHIIDMADGRVDGTPDLHSLRDYASWTKALSKNFLELQERVENGQLKKNAVLRAYGATNEAEFFAVATEAFFERPMALKSKAPDLYAVLEGYFRADPTVFAKRHRKKEKRKWRSRNLIRQ